MSDVKPLERMRGFFIEFDDEILGFVNEKDYGKCDRIFESIKKILSSGERDYLFRGLGDFCRVKDVKSACEFYLENKDNPLIFVSEYPRYKGELDELLGVSWQDKISLFAMRNELVLKYNEWLFRMAFKDVI